jgi:hypothetical protein
MAMLGSSCSPCCVAEGCPCPEGEPVPYRVTVALSGLTHTSTKVENLVGLSFSAPFGSGASGTVSVGGGKVGDPGFPISSVSLTSGGSGYARLGRRAPALTITGSGTGATFTPTFSISNDSLGFPRWSVASISASGGTGYDDGEQITIAAAEGDTVEQAAAGTIRTLRGEPAITASASGGSGATFGVTVAPNDTTPQTWSVTGVTVANGGTGYPDSGYITFNAASGDTVEQSANAMFYCGRVAPTVTAIASGSGSGASLSASLSSAIGYYDGRPYWYVDGISITNGGTGYAEYDSVSVTATDGDGYGAYAIVTSVDEDGAITGVAVYWGGEYYKSNGIIESVILNSGGTYYRDTGQASGVTVDAGGLYYREDASLQPYVATVTVTVTQNPPSNGSGATVAATVNADTSSSSFGSVSGITLTNAGAGYLGWAWDECLLSQLNGRSFTLPKVRAMVGSQFAKTGNLLPLLFESSLGGVGAAATVVAPGGEEDIDNGPITSVSLTNGGSGYARIGREQPSLDIQRALGSFGSGAAFTPTFSQRQDAYGLDYWVVSSVSVSGGSCYGLNGRQGPYLTAAVPGGSGAFFSVQTVQTLDECGGVIWIVSEISVSVGNNWTPYPNNAPVTITAHDGAVVRTAAAATLQTDEIGRPVGVTIANWGAYFKKGPDESLRITPATTDDKQQQQAVLILQTDDDGKPTGVTVTNGGAYYRENKSLPPYSPGVNVVLNQISPSNGTGAAFAATVDSDPYSSNFGKISSVSLSSAGDNYLSWAYPRTCLYSRCVLVRGTHYGGFGSQESASAAQITVELKGPSRPPEVRVSMGRANIFAPCPCRSCTTATVTLTADPEDAPFGCEGTLFTASEQFGGQATVTAGSSGEPCYEQILAANSLSITLSGENAEFTVQRPQPSYQVNRPWEPLPDNPHCWQNTYDEQPNRVRVRLTGGKTNGADLAGTFSCELVEQFPNGGKRFRYDMGTVCGLPWGSWPGADQSLGSKPMLVSIELFPVGYSSTGVQQGNGFVSIFGLATKWRGVENDGLGWLGFDDTDGSEVSESCRTTNLTSGGAQAFPCFGDITNIRGAVVSPIVFRSSSSDYPLCGVTWASDPNISIDSIEIEE